MRKETSQTAKSNGSLLEDMVPQFQRIMIKHLVDTGVKKAVVARQFGISRETVRHIAKEESPKTRKSRASKLDPFKDYIRQRLETYRLSAIQLFEEIQQKGYTGSYSLVKPFVRACKQTLATKVTERYETPPGEQAQLDWGECGTIDVQGQRRKLYVFTLVLSHSRMLFARFTTSMSQPALLSCLRQGFETLGIPRKVLLDNMKTAVDLHQPGADPVWNKRFLDFAQHHGFMPIAAPPYWPRVKGKVENGVGYVKHRFLEGRSFTSLDDLNAQLGQWLDTIANVRIHGTTREQPVMRFQREQAALRPLAVVPRYQTEPVSSRQVAWDCHFSWKGTRYSVPPAAAGQRVEVHEDGNELVVCFLQQELARHGLAVPGTPAVTGPEHMLAARQARKGILPRRSQPRFEQVAEPCLESPLTAYDRLLEARA